MHDRSVADGVKSTASRHGRGFLITGDDQSAGSDPARVTGL
jgi:hypothetical protein